MRKLFFLVALCASLSIGTFAFAEAPSNPAHGEKLLPYNNPLETVQFSDGTSVSVYSTNLREDTAGLQRLLYVPIPFVNVGEKPFFDPETKRLFFYLSLQYRSEQIAKGLKTEAFKNVPIIAMPIRGYSVTVIANNGVKEVVASTEEDGKEYNLLGKIPVSHVVQDPQLIEALKDPETIQIEVSLVCRFKNTFGGEIQASKEFDLQQKVEETLFNSTRDTIFIPKKDLENLIRDIKQDVLKKLQESYSIELSGQCSDAMNQWIERFFNPNSKFWEETNFMAVSEVIDSLIFYEKKFGLKELTPREIENIINNSEKSDELKTKIVSDLHALSQIAKKSTDIQDFIKKVSEADEYAVGASYAGFGASGSYKTMSSEEKENYEQKNRETFEMMKNDSFNAEEFYHKTSENISGSLRDFFTRPKRYNVIRLTRANLHQQTQFRLQQIDTIVTSNETIKFKTCITSAAEMENTNEIVASLEAQANDLQARLDSATNELQKSQVDNKKAAEEIENLKKEIEKLYGIIDFITRNSK